VVCVAMVSKEQADNRSLADRLVAVCCRVLQYVAILYCVAVWCGAMVSKEQTDNRSLADRLVAVC